MSPTAQGVSFVAMLVIVTAAFVWLMLPFYGAVLWAVIIAILFNPLQRRLVQLLGGRRSLAAAISTFACICIVVIPGSMVLAALAREANTLYTLVSDPDFDAASIFERIQAGMPAFLVNALSFFNLSEFHEIQARLLAFVGEAAQTIANSALTIGQGTAQLIISLGVMLYVLFFMFRDGSRLAAVIRKASPLSDYQTEHILRKFTSVVKYTVRGNVIIAAVQGFIGGTTFWLLGIEAAFLWGVLMAVLSLLPAVGAFLVWAPAAAYLLLSGQTVQGVILIAVGVLIIGMVDNLLRPPLVGQGAKLPDYMVLVSTLGGLSLFGVNGFVIGPLIAAVFVSVWSLYTDEQSSVPDEQLMVNSGVEEIARASESKRE
jgi:predicted PurR-regulated permease PerM